MSNYAYTLMHYVGEGWHAVPGPNMPEQSTFVWKDDETEANVVSFLMARVAEAQEADAAADIDCFACGAPWVDLGGIAGEVRDHDESCPQVTQSKVYIERLG